MFEEVGEFCVGVSEVTWMKPRRGGYFYARVWKRSDPQKVVKCCHRHRRGESALDCGVAYVTSGEVRSDFDMDSGEEIE